MTLLALAMSVWPQTNAIDLDKQLLNAVKARDIPTVARLLKIGANPMAPIPPTNALRTSLEIASDDLIYLLIKTCPPTAHHQAASVGVKWAIEHDNSKFVKRLAALPSWKSIRVHTMPPLSFAIISGSNKCVSYLASSQSNFEKDDLGRVPLHYAAKGGPKMISKLALSRYSVNIKDNSGSTPLHIATRYRFESVEPLLRSGADPNIRNKLGDTPADYLSSQADRRAYNQLLLQVRPNRH